jgi:hypothetical protein
MQYCILSISALYLLTRVLISSIESVSDSLIKMNESETLYHELADAELITDDDEEQHRQHHLVTPTVPTEDSLGDLVAFPRNIYFLFTTFLLVNEIFDLKSLSDTKLHSFNQAMIVLFYLFQSGIASLVFVLVSFCFIRFPNKLTEKLVTKQPIFTKIK